MKISIQGQAKGHLWLISAVLISIFAMHSEGATSLSPPSLFLSPTYAPVIKVVGKVYCYRCFNEAHPEQSHGKEHLKGAMVKVTCQANDQALVGFGYTESNGKYSVNIEGFPLSSTYGADSCKVELHAAPAGSDCNVPIELNLSGLSVHSKSNEEVVLRANQIMAFASKKTFGCWKPHIVPHPFHYKFLPSPYQYTPPPSYQYPSPPHSYYSSPPPYQQSTPPNKYQPPPASYNYPPTPQSYKSPIPPRKYLPPPYYYNSPPPLYQYSSPQNNYISPPPPYQYSSPPYNYKSPLLPSSPMPPYYYNSPPPYQYSPPPYYYGSSPPPYQYSPPLAPKHLHPKVPHEKSPPPSLTSPQPLYHYSSPPPLQHDDKSSTPPSAYSYQSPTPSVVVSTTNGGP